MSLRHVDKTSAEYSAEQQARFREVFAPHAKRYRRYTLLSSLIAVIVFFVFLAAINYLPRLGLGWIYGFLILGVFGLILFGWWSQPLLECPACRNQLDSERFGRFCPECASNQITPGGWLQSPGCTACGATMGRRRSRRRYKIRACTHCGVMLDERGV